MPQPINSADLRRVLLVQTAFLGDVVLTLPLVEGAKRAGAEWITVATSPAGAEAFESAEGVDEVVVLDKHGAHRTMSATRAAAAVAGLRGFSAALVPHRSLRSAIFARASGAPVRVGFDASAGRVLLTHHVPYHFAEPEILRNLSLLRAFGSGLTDGLSTIFSIPRNRQPRTDVTVLIAPGSQWGAKRWPLSNYRELVTLCVAQGWRVAVSGSAREQELCASLCRSFEGQYVTNHAGSTTWQTLCAHIAESSIVVSNDTATVHVANAVGTPVVAIFGPTVPEFGFAPRGLYDRVVQIHGFPCRPCSIHGGNECPLGTHLCMTDISALTVMHAVADTLRVLNEIA